MGLLGKPTILGNPYTDLDRKIMVIAIILKEVARPLRYSWDINPTDSLGMSRHLEFKTSNLDNHLDITNNAKGGNINPHMKCDHHLKKLTICSHFFLNVSLWFNCRSQKIPSWWAEPTNPFEKSCSSN